MNHTGIAEGERAPGAWTMRTVLALALPAYAVLAGILAVRQAGYINADFVGYVSVAHRLLEGSAQAITGFWSPLFSWCMVPLIWAGMGDLAAGRAVLLLGGLVYVIGAYGVSTRFWGADRGRNNFLTAGVVTCAVVQGALWATAFLDPDILAAAMLLVCFTFVLDPAVGRKKRSAFLGGLAAGAAYLAKAYMLPYLMVIVPVIFLLRWWTGSGQGREWWRAWGIFMAGAALAAGPWIGALTTHYQRITFSTVGTAAHANVSPENFTHDPLWSPGLVQDFIGDPHLEGDWSPVASWRNFSHQMWIVRHNLQNAAGHITFWLALMALGLGGIGVAMIGGRRIRDLVSADDVFAVVWSALAVAIYCGGYSLVILDARYIVPVAAPVICVGALVMIGAVLAQGGRLDQRWRDGNWAMAGVILVMLFLGQDFYRIARISMHHGQCMRLARFAEVDQRMKEAGIPPGPLAASEFHYGLFLAYARGGLRDYWGTPVNENASGMTDQLRKSPIQAYVRWVSGKNGVACPGLQFVPESPWALAFEMTDGDGTKVAVYVRREVGRVN